MDGNDFLMGGGAPSARFPTKGTRVAGEVLAVPETRQQTDMVTKAPKFYKNGDPMMSVVVRIQTEMRDPSIPNDDGERRCFVKGRAIKALREAVKAAGVKRIEPGGYFAMQWVDSMLPTGGLPEGEKIYQFTYTPPAASASSDEADMPDWAREEPPVRHTPASEPPRGASTSVNVPAGGNPLEGLSDEQKRALAAIGFKVP